MNTISRHSVEARAAFGKSLRKQTPRKSHARWSPGCARPDPVALLEEQNRDRLQWLVPVRHARMMASPFAFYRAGARIMAADLATTPVSGLMVQACGDAHLANFGFYASPERDLLFDLNDFDETLEGPWEWDLKRLATSFVIAARHNALGAAASRAVAELVAQSYRESMNEFAGWRTADIWYARLDARQIVRSTRSARIARRAQKSTAKAQTRDSRQALDKLAEQVDGDYRIKSEPPLLEPLRDLTGTLDRAHFEAEIMNAFRIYEKTLYPHIRTLLSRYHPVDCALKVVGVGSVGTRCWVLLLEGRDCEDPLFLQMKEATHSVLAEHLRSSPYKNQGRRVVEGQRLIQAASDIYLGWCRVADSSCDYYWRQLRDWKGSVDIDALDADSLDEYARRCAWTLARAHARSGDAVAIAGYLGLSDTLDKALSKFAGRYADQNERDYEEFVAKVNSGQLSIGERPS